MNSEFVPSLFVQSLIAPDTRDLAGDWLAKSKSKGSKTKPEQSSRWLQVLRESSILVRFGSIVCLYFHILRGARVVVLAAVR
jgi:hypothetical protein